MKAIVSGLLWAAALLLVALASRMGVIARGSAQPLVLGLAVIAAIRLGAIGQRRRKGESCQGGAR